MKWHLECLPDGLWKTAQTFSTIVNDHQAVLAGGTALAMKIGHRISVDLDFFTEKKPDHDQILSFSKKHFEDVGILVEDPRSFVLTTKGAKVSFFYHEYPFLDKVDLLDEIKIAGVLDIAAMKLIAISQRGLKRDFVDLFCIMQEVPFFKIAEHTKKRYGESRVNPVVIGKSLVYFNDADGEPEPRYLATDKSIRWVAVKAFFRRHVRQMVLDLDGQ